MSYRTYKVPPSSVTLPAARVGPPAFSPAEWVNAVGVNRDWAGLNFADATTQNIVICLPVPQDYTSGLRKIRLRWKSTVTAGNVKWEVQHEPTANGQAWDEAYSGGPDSVTTAVSGTAGVISETTITMTGAAWGAGDAVFILVSRKGSDGADTLAGTACLVDIDVLVEVNATITFGKDRFTSADLVAGASTSTYTLSNTPDVNDALALYVNGILDPAYTLVSVTPASAKEWWTAADVFEIYGTTLSGDGDDFELRYVL